MQKLCSCRLQKKIKKVKIKKVRKINGEKVGWELVNRASCLSLNVVSPNIKCHIGLCLYFYSRRVDKQCTFATRVSNADTVSSTHFAGKLPVLCQSLSRQTLSIQSVCSRWELHFPLLKPIRWEVTLEAIEAKAGNRCWARLWRSGHAPCRDWPPSRTHRG